MEKFEHLNHYELLGIEPNVSADDLKRAYRQQVARYHPDRYGHASPEEQAYASARTQRINEAYRVLSDAHLREAYDRKIRIPSTRRRAHDSPKAPSSQQNQPRDYSSELYEQACSHLKAGRYMQATATLRELQKLNPFYRDVATLLEQARAGLHSTKRTAKQTTAEEPSKKPSETSTHETRKSSYVPSFIGGLGVLALIGIVSVLWIIPQSNAKSNGSVALTAVPSVSQASESASPDPLLQATTAPLPTATQPIPSPTATALPESHIPVIMYDFSDPAEWAALYEETWSVGTEQGVYRINAQAGIGNILSYHTTLGLKDYVVESDVAATGGSAGLVVYFVDAQNYVAFLYNAKNNRYRLERYLNGNQQTLVEDTARNVSKSDQPMNHITARLNGKRVQVSINETLIIDRILPDITPTDTYGLVAAGEETAVSATFDNVQIRRLEEQ